MLLKIQRYHVWTLSWPFLLKFCGVYYFPWHVDDFVRSGHISPADTVGTFRYAGVYGYEWSSRTSPTSSTLAYWFEFSATESRPSWGPYERYNGFPLRCLSTVLDI